MTQNNFDELNNKSETELLLNETKDSLNQLKQRIGGTFEYKNRSRDGKYFVFSYNTIKGETITDIKQKYIKQYGGRMEGLFVTDASGKEIRHPIFKGGEKIYLKVKMNNHPNPIKFIDITQPSGHTKKTCIIRTPGWNPVSIRQIYQDEFDVVIEQDRFIITDSKGNVYDDSHKFTVGDKLFIEIKKKSSETKGKENTLGHSELEKGRNTYKELIEKQNSPLTHGNRNNPEISITFDDGHGAKNIEHILDTLKGSGIKATFFILGECIKLTPSLWKRAIEEGHQICCHTYSHIYLNNDGNITSFNNGLNKDIKVDGWVNNVKHLLGEEYYKNLQAKSGGNFPINIKSDLLLETEILMREAQVKQTLGQEYLDNLKQNYPFFRFPGGCGSKIPENIAVLKKLGYLSIGWSDDMKRYHKNEKGKIIGTHLTVEEIENLEIENGDIPLFHFKQDDYKYIDAYIENLKRKNKYGKTVSDIIE